MSFINYSKLKPGYIVILCLYIYTLRFKKKKIKHCPSTCTKQILYILYVYLYLNTVTIQVGQKFLSILLGFKCNASVLSTYLLLICCLKKNLNFHHFHLILLGFLNTNFSLIVEFLDNITYQ